MLVLVPPMYTFSLLLTFALYTLILFICSCVLLWTTRSSNRIDTGLRELSLFNSSDLSCDLVEIVKIWLF